MSTRALRKFRDGGGKGFQSGPDIGNGGVADDPEGLPLAAASSAAADLSGGARSKGGMPRRNVFDLLLNDGQQDSCSESEVKEDDDKGSQSPDRAAGPGDAADVVTAAALNRSQCKKKRKAKRKANKASAANTGRSSEDNLEFEVGPHHNVHQYGRRQSAGGAGAEASATSGGGGGHGRQLLLAIEPRNLNPEYEMKKIFGSRVVLAEQRHSTRRGPGGRARAHRPSNHHWLVVPKPSWPNPGNTGLRMKFLESDRDGNQYFAFEHSSQYRSVQQDFFDAVNGMDPDSIVRILNNHPFHIDSLLQLSEICKAGEDSQTASELTERALFALEAAFHPLFNLVVGSCRLDYRRQENRSFFLALFRHLTNVGQRACYRTSLELCKVLLSLDPEADPLGVLLMLDFYALRANQQKWFLQLYKEWKGPRNLDQLPNFAYSVALAHFHQVCEGEAADADASAAAAAASADEAIQYALIMFPGVLLPLLDKCSIEPDKRAAAHPFFLKAQSAETAPSKGLHLLCRLYVGRSYHLWKEPRVLPWLEANVTRVLDRVDSQADEVVQDCAEKRKVRYQGTPRNVYRHVLISELKEVTVLDLPWEMAANSIMSYDPLPPADSIDSYNTASRTSAALSSGSHSALRLFFRSLMPNYNPGEPPPTRPGDGGGAAGGPAVGAAAAVGGNELQVSVTSLLDAMRDLLGGLHLPEMHGDEDAGASADSENDEEDWR